MDDFMDQFATRMLNQDYDTWAPILMPDGTARQAMWRTKDGWFIAYTTERVTGGRWHGKFVTMAYRPYGKGARTNKATQWRRVYARAFATRKAARARAEALYYQHSPLVR